MNEFKSIYINVDMNVQLKIFDMILDKETDIGVYLHGMFIDRIYNIQDYIDEKIEDDYE